jgi:outer membrane biosynthesis protein TonB
MKPFSFMSSRSSSFKTPYRHKGPRTKAVKRSQIGLVLAAILMGVIFLNYRLLSSSSTADADVDATSSKSQNVNIQVPQQEDPAHAPAPPPEKVKAPRHGKLPLAPSNPPKPSPQVVRKEKKQRKMMKKNGSGSNNNNNNNNKPLAPGYADSTDRNPYPYQGTPGTTAKNSGSPTAVQVLNQPLNEETATILPMADPLTSSPNTMVIAYFRVESKYPSSKYDDWMRNIFSLQDCMVVFTQPDMVETVQRLRAHAADRTVIVVQPSPADLPVSQLYQESHANSSFWKDQLNMDREQKRHRSFQLFWIWLSKSWWVVQAIHRNFFHSDFFMYSDIGCFRSAAWNGKTLIRHPHIVPKNTVLWMAHHKPNPPDTRLWNDKFREKDHFYHSGSQGAGTAEAWRRYHQVFAETMDQFASNGLFIGEDQCILQSACLGSYATAPVGNNGNTSGTVDERVCTYAPFDQVPDNHYFGLRHVLHHGGNNYHFWKPPLGIDMA